MRMYMARKVRQSNSRIPAFNRQKADGRMCRVCLYSRVEMGQTKLLYTVSAN